MKSFISITRFFALIFISLMISSCKGTQDTNEELATIDVKKAYNEPLRDLMLSEIVEDIEYVKLETRPECFIGRPTGYAISEHYVVVYDNTTKRVLLFTKEGKYLRDIGSQGKGPKEYIYFNAGSL